MRRVFENDVDLIRIYCSTHLMNSNQPVRQNEVKETKLETSKNVNDFKGKLLSLGVNATVRRRLGSDINASCGQLRRTEQDKCEN